MSRTLLRCKLVVEHHSRTIFDHHAVGADSGVRGEYSRLAHQLPRTVEPLLHLRIAEGTAKQFGYLSVLCIAVYQSLLTVQVENLLCIFLTGYMREYVMA